MSDEAGEAIEVAGETGLFKPLEDLLFDAPEAETCPNCDMLVLPEDRFCESCGTALPGRDIGEPPSPGGSAADMAATSDAAASAARPTSDITAAGDPVDVATGEVIVPQTDVWLPGRLQLAVRRVHRSGHRGGRWFGRSWASTLDQRLVVAGQAVVFTAEDGMVLRYERPAGDGVVFPVAGRPWPLARDGDGYTLTDPQQGLVRRFAQRPGFYVSAAGDGELPLVSVSDRGGHNIRFGYSENGAPESVSYDGGYRVAIVVSGERVAGLVLAGAGRDGQGIPLARYGYSEAGDLAEVVNSSGIALRYFYDEAGRITGWTDRNGWSYQYSYDQLGRCVRCQAPDGTLSGTFAYDSDGLVTTYTDAAGAVTRYQITARGQVVAVADPLGNLTRHEHDPCGRLVSRTDPLGRVTRWSYDGAGNLAAVTRPDGSRAVAVYNEMNLPTAITGPGGAAWLLDYDEAGNPIRQTAPDGAVTEYAWVGGCLAAVTGPLGATTTVQCDAAGLPVTVTSPDGATTRYARDGFGRVTAVTAPDGKINRLTWAVEGQLTSRTGPDGTAEQFSYDAMGNLVGYLNPAQELTRFEYRGFSQMTARTGPDGIRTEFFYDQALRLTTVTHCGLTWRYEHDPAGRVIAETDCNGGTTNYSYDSAGQLTGRVNAEGQQLSLLYDLLGNVTQRSSDGVVTRYGYDLAGQLAWARSPDAWVEFERDPVGRVTAEFCNGRAVRSAYDAAGRRIQRLMPSGVQTTWDYDAVGRPVTLRTSGQQLRFGYDKAGREILRDLPGGLRLTQQWDPAGRLATQAITSAPGALTPQPVPGPPDKTLQHRRYTYRADGLLTDVSDLLSGLRRFSLDRSGRVTAVSGPGWAEQYSYDPAGNITAADWPALPGDLTAQWAGDRAQGPRDYSGTLISQAGGLRYQHDACGRITLRQQMRDSGRPGAWRYTWDAEDKLTEVITPDGASWQYIYDPLGRRIAKLRTGTAGRAAELTQFTWDGITLAEQVTTAGGGAAASAQTITWDYRPGAFTPLTQTQTTTWPEVSQEQADRQFYAIITDLIGAPAELTAPDGTLASHQHHTLWGITSWQPGAAPTPLRFPGQYHDAETGLHYNDHRYYDPLTGRYLTPDPLGTAPGPNPHIYVPNPLVLADPLGLDPASGGGSRTTVWRFHTASDPDTLIPNVYRADPITRARVLSSLKDPQVVKRLADDHMTGDTGDSPFVSVTTDHAAAATTDDPWLGTIITGLPGDSRAQPAPDLSEFSVPTGRLTGPMYSNETSISEGEMLFQGKDLGDFLVKTIPNPYLAPPPAGA